MSAASPTAFSLWAILSVLFLIFLVHHLWCYDRFKCLRWSAGQHGAFKRVMTYSYLGAVPLLAVYSIGMTVIKYREGFAHLPDRTILPVPINDYRDANRSWVLPLQFVFSFAWALEMVTHLEELAFWLYLLHQNPEKEAWFSSWEYRLWYMGSLISIVGMPLTALITRRNLETCDAYIFLVGAAGSTSTTIAFLYVLWRFPRFIRHVKAEGADPTVVVRLATFYNLNQVRVVFRFMFTIPLLVLALDGIVGEEHRINRNLFATDFLQMIAGLGCFVSSMITLLIFFPRSIVREAGYKPKVASSLGAHSPKSPPITPPPPLRAQYAPPPHHHHLPPHMAGYATPNGLRMSVTGGTGVSGVSGVSGTGASGMTWEMEGSAYTYTPSACSPRESLSLYDSPQYTYTAEDEGGGGGVQRRRSSRKARRVSRRVSVYSGTMDAHPERDSDDDGEDGDGDGDGDEDEERVPPYSHTVMQSHPPHPHPHPHARHSTSTPTSTPLHSPPLPPDLETPAPSPPPQVHIHQRHPFPHSLSSPHIVTLPAQMQKQQQQQSPSLSPPLSLSLSLAQTQEAPPPAPAPHAKRQVDWEERRPLRGEAVEFAAAARRRSLHVITTAPGVNIGLGLVSTALGGGRGAGAEGEGGGGGEFASLYLVDLPPRDELPRAV
ncbi:hypothetical protein L226DRAFT_563597 [Lentinus tigrinus ALCF2SS1-7]|uniref:uncharacterized protein n=1 Tax=Lentinus tigrinus ALCF2SS1-7 TaxID=1328758 RepID=UPI0011663172|nr:hypothetical protein L226DRAFT_563597 [Lentinus tigrinus ALCF2SS1-7]